MTTGNRYTRDEHGKEVLLSSKNEQVMMEWEKEYMHACVDALGIESAISDVLEIGFGCAYSASRIQSHEPRSHTIIECDETVIKDKFLPWEKSMRDKYPQTCIKLVQGTWQKVLETCLEHFDCVFFDDFPLPETQLNVEQRSEEEQKSLRNTRWHTFLRAVAKKHVREGGRITGYLARRLNLRFAGCTTTISDFQVNVPRNCLYFDRGTMFIPLITLHSVQEFVEGMYCDVLSAKSRRKVGRLQAMQERLATIQQRLSTKYSNSTTTTHHVEQQQEEDVLILQPTTTTCVPELVRSRKERIEKLRQRAKSHK